MTASHPSRISDTLHTSYWRLKVRDVHGQKHFLEFSNITETEAMRRATLQGLQVLAVDANVKPAIKLKNNLKARFSLLLFSQELLALLEAGLNLTEALTTLHTKERQASAQALLANILQTLSEGRSFSDVLAQHERHFPLAYIATVRAAERTGNLPQALARYITYQSQFDTLRKKIISAAIYPTMLLIIGSFVTLFLLGYVVPRFSIVYESSGRDLPWLSTWLLIFGKFIYMHWQIALAGVMSLFLLAIWGISRVKSRAWLLQILFKLPWLADKIDVFRLTRFYRTLSLLLASGISLTNALNMAAGLLSTRQQQALTQCSLAVEQGQRLSMALMRVNLLTPVAESLIKVGERSGQLADMLERTARLADEEFTRWIDWSARLLEPLLMTIMGLVIGAVVVLMYLPIFELAGSLQ